MVVVAVARGRVRATELTLENGVGLGGSLRVKGAVPDFG